MKIHALVAGLHVLMKYDPHGDLNICTGHDELHAGGPAPNDLAGEDQAKLIELGWRWDETHESWSKFT